LIGSSFPILYVESVARAVDFYGGLLGFETVYSFPPGDEPGFVSPTERRQARGVA